MQDIETRFAPILNAIIRFQRFYPKPNSVSTLNRIFFPEPNSGRQDIETRFAPILNAIIVGQPKQEDDQAVDEVPPLQSAPVESSLFFFVTLKPRVK